MNVRMRAWHEDALTGGDATDRPRRLYMKVARSLMEDLRSGRFAVGTRMPAERDLALRMGVSRPVIREALLALEVLGYVEVRIGSGAYVVCLPDTSADRAKAISPVDLAHARLLIEGEAAALAAINVDDEELAVLESAVEAMRRDGDDFDAWQEALTTFHMTIAAATRNAALERSLRDLWDMRLRSPECRRLLERARERNFRPSVEQHEAMLAAFRAPRSRAGAGGDTHAPGRVDRPCAGRG